MKKTVFVKPIKSTIVPPHSEYIFPVKLDEFEDGSTVLLEPCTLNLSDQEIAGCKTVCKVQNKTGVFRVLNPTALPVFLKSRKAKATARLIDEDECYIFSEDEHAVNISCMNPSATCDFSSAKDIQ